MWFKSSAASGPRPQDLARYAIPRTPTTMESLKVFEPLADRTFLLQFESLGDRHIHFSSSLARTDRPR